MGASGMITKEQLVHLFDRFAFLTAQPDVKKRISDAVTDKQNWRMNCQLPVQLKEATSWFVSVNVLDWSIKNSIEHNKWAARCTKHPPFTGLGKGSTPRSSVTSIEHYKVQECIANGAFPLGR